MNKIWFYMMIASLCALLCTTPSVALSEMISASTGALTLSIQLCGVYAVWLGMLELVDKSGLSEKLASLLKPIIKKLFKTNNKEAEKLIALNMSANMLGLGNASTPMGIKAAQKLDDGSGIATPALIMLIVINATSIQLLPSTVIGLRASAGSINASDIILPTLLSTILTSGLGVCLTLLCNKLRFKRRKK